MGDSNPQLIPPHNKTPTHTHFLYKAIFLSIFLLILPLFSSSSSSSSSPDFIINTTSWELLQLLFVGIVVSYGLFSTKRNLDDETHKEEGTDAQSYVARLFQVSSSLFDDDDDDDFEIKTPCASSSASASASSQEDNKSITSSSSKVWNSQYYRGEPVVVVANKESSSSTTSVTEKDKKQPVVVGSLRSRVVSKVDRSSSRSKLLLSSPEEKEEEEKEENIDVLRSPIPWRSRSRRNMEPNPPPASPSISIYQSLNPVVPSPSSVLETRSKSFQDFGSSSRKKITSPPIPPPPPPPPLPLNRINRKEFTRNYDLQNSRGTRGGTSLSSSSSFRTRNQDEEDNYLSHDQEIESFIETRGGKFIIDEQNFIPNPKQQKQQQEDDKKKKEITDTEESSSEDDDDEDDELHELASKSSNGNGNGNGNEGEIVGPDVDKKADEFIAKFREQIRLQRIASIRTSTQPQHTSK